MLASFRIENDGSIGNVKIPGRSHPTADKALQSLLRGMYRRRRSHQIGVLEKAMIRIANHYGKPQYIFIMQESFSANGGRQTDK